IESAVPAYVPQPADHSNPPAGPTPRRLHRRHVGAVTGLPLRDASRLLDGGEGRMQAVAIDVDRVDARTLVGEQARRGPADAGTRPRHEHRLARKSLPHVSSTLLRPGRPAQASRAGAASGP